MKNIFFIAVSFTLCKITLSIGHQLSLLLNHNQYVMHFSTPYQCMQYMAYVVFLADAVEKWISDSSNIPNTDGSCERSLVIILVAKIGLS